MSRAELEARVVELLHELSRHVRQRAFARLGEFDLTPPMAVALHHLDEPVSMGTLADRLSCDASYVTGLADRLETRGLVERQPDAADRRVKQLVLTEAGRQLRQRVHDRLYANPPMLEALDDDELERFAAIIQKVLDAGATPPSR